jgi:hypothetical protein
MCAIARGGDLVGSWVCLPPPKVLYVSVPIDPQPEHTTLCVAPNPAWVTCAYNEHRIQLHEREGH